VGGAARQTDGREEQLGAVVGTPPSGGRRVIRDGLPA
jgi:hypothetical protein